MNAKKSVSMKVVVLLMAAVLLIGGAVGGTLAWLLDKTDTVTNTFTVGNIDIDLKEHNLQADGTLDQNTEVTEEDTYKIIPGTSQPKDPFVRVEANSEACWVFIKVEEKNDADVYIIYGIDTTVWTPLGDSYPGIYYKDQAATTADVTLNILKDQKVSYSADLTKTQIDNLYDIVDDDAGNVISMTMKNASELPKLEFTAYAIQKVNANGTTFTAADAWTELNKSAN